jgi:protein ATS1
MSHRSRVDVASQNPAIRLQLIHMTGRTRLLSSGSNGTGQLGIGHAEDVSTWTDCSFADAAAGSSVDRVRKDLPGRVLAIASGAGHAILLLKENAGQEAATASHLDHTSVWTTGSNEAGQLGPSYTMGDARPAHNVWKRLDTDRYLRLAGLDLSSEYRYIPKDVACSWTTTFICFVRTKETKQLEGGGPQRQSDIIISFGTNNFGELGAGIVQGGDSSSGKLQNSVHLVKFNKQDGHKGIISVRKMKASHRNIACIIDLLPEEGLPGPLESKVLGWGAGRHGQLDPKTGVTAKGQASSAQTVDRTPRSPGSRSFVATQSSSRVGSRWAVGGIKFKKGEFPSSYPAPVSVDARSILKLDPGTELHIDDLAVGAGHMVLRISVARDSSSNVIVGLGNNAKAQLSFAPVGSTRWGSIACTWNGTFMTALDPSPKIYTTGANTHGQLGYRDTVLSEETVSQISSVGNKVAQVVETEWGAESLDIVCGSEHVIILATLSATCTKAWVWGWNEHGNLGLDDVQDRWTPTGVSLDSNLNIVGAWAGCGTSWIVVEEIVDVVR